MFANYNSGNVTKLVVRDNELALQKFTRTGDEDTYVGETIIGEVKV